MLHITRAVVRERHHPARPVVHTVEHVMRHQIHTLSQGISLIIGPVPPAVVLVRSQTMAKVLQLQMRHLLMARQLPLRQLGIQLNSECFILRELVAVAVPQPARPNVRMVKHVMPRQTHTPRHRARYLLVGRALLKIMAVVELSNLVHLLAP